MDVRILMSVIIFIQQQNFTIWRRFILFHIAALPIIRFVLWKSPHSTRDDLLNREIRDSRAVHSTSGHSATGNEIRARTYDECMLNDALRSHLLDQKEFRLTKKSPNKICSWKASDKILYSFLVFYLKINIATKRFIK